MNSSLNIIVFENCLVYTLQDITTQASAGIENSREILFSVSNNETLRKQIYMYRDAVEQLKVIYLRASAVAGTKIPCKICYSPQINDYAKSAINKLLIAAGIESVELPYINAFQLGVTSLGLRRNLPFAIMEVYDTDIHFYYSGHDKQQTVKNHLDKNLEDIATEVLSDLMVRAVVKVRFPQYDFNDDSLRRNRETNQGEARGQIYAFNSTSQIEVSNCTVNITDGKYSAAIRINREEFTSGLQSYIDVIKNELQLFLNNAAFDKLYLVGDIIKFYSYRRIFELTYKEDKVQAVTREQLINVLLLGLLELSDSEVAAQKVVVPEQTMLLTPQTPPQQAPQPQSPPQQPLSPPPSSPGRTINDTLGEYKRDTSLNSARTSAAANNTYTDVKGGRPQEPAAEPTKGSVRDSAARPEGVPVPQAKKGIRKLISNPNSEKNAIFLLVVVLLTIGVCYGVKEYRKHSKSDKETASSSSNTDSANAFPGVAFNAFINAADSSSRTMAFTLLKNSTYDQHLISDSLCSRGIELFKSNERDAAKVLFDASISLDKNCVAYCMLGNIYCVWQEDINAKTQYTIASKADKKPTAGKFAAVYNDAMHKLDSLNKVD